MNSINAIVFDLGNVLIPFDYSIMINRLNNISYDLGKKYYDIYKLNYYVHRQYERGEVTNDQFININLEWLENKIDAEKFCYLYSNIFRLNEDTISLLPILKMNYKLFLLSNTNFIHHKYGYAKYEFLKLFDKLFLSHEVGAVKPEKQIYKAVENYSQFKPDEHLFVDDILEYVDGAKNIGWNAVQFTTHKKLIEDFKSYNIL